MSVSRFLRTFLKYPVVKNSLHVSTQWFACDCCAQFIERKEKFDFRRNAELTSIGLCYAGPSLHYWYVFLHRYVQAETKILALVKKVALDQLFYSPMFLIGLIVLAGILHGLNAEDIKKKLGRDFLDIMKLSYMVWPLVQTINFYAIPRIYQVLFNQVFSFIWNTILFLKLNAAPQK